MLVGLKSATLHPVNFPAHLICLSLLHFESEKKSLKMPKFKVVEGEKPWLKSYKSWKPKVKGESELAKFWRSWEPEEKEKVCEVISEENTRQKVVEDSGCKQ